MRYLIFEQSALSALTGPPPNYWIVGVTPQEDNCVTILNNWRSLKDGKVSSTWKERFSLEGRKDLFLSPEQLIL